MKKIAIIAMMMLLFVAGVCGCGSDEAAQSAERSVTITLPRAVFGTQSDDEIRETAEAEDIVVRFGEDDTVTYQMTPEVQQELLLGFKTHFEENLQSVLDAGDIPGLVSVDYNDDMSVFTVSVNRATFQEEGGDAQLGMLYSAGTTYQLYAGKEEEAIDVTVTLVDHDSGEEFDTFSMRQVFNEQQIADDEAD